MDRYKRNEAIPPAGQRRASAAWAWAGFIFGLFAVAVALITDKGDGRVSKSVGGCLLWLVLLGFILFGLVGLEWLGESIPLGPYIYTLF